jgi:hypothetical protein
VISTTLGGSVLVALPAAILPDPLPASAATPIPLAPQPGQGRATRGVEISAAGLLAGAVHRLLGRRISPVRAARVAAARLRCSSRSSAKQWMWTFAYPNGRGSKGVLYVPAARAVRLAMTSRDVIHSFFVPEFRVKKDVIPGRTTELWFEAREPGTYRRVLALEYWGKGTSTMRAPGGRALGCRVHASPLDRLPPFDFWTFRVLVYRSRLLAGVRAARSPFSLVPAG